MSAPIGRQPLAFLSEVWRYGCLTQRAELGPICSSAAQHRRGSTLISPAPGSPQPPMRFDGTRRYVATDDLKVAVNAAITLSRPLLVKGEPGTGKTALALEVADAIGVPIIEWHIKSTTKAHQGL